MKRLTERTDIGDSPLDEIAFINPDDAEGLYNLRDIAKHGNDELLYEIANRLAEYEDMEEQGLLVRLPCKVGDSFFVHRKFCDEHGELEESVEHWGSDCYGCNLPCNGKLKVVERKFNSICHIIANMEGIGDSIFLSREEAEKALEDCND